MDQTNITIHWLRPFHQQSSKYVFKIRFERKIRFTNTTRYPPQPFHEQPTKYVDSNQI